MSEIKLPDTALSAPLSMGIVIWNRLSVAARPMDRRQSLALTASLSRKTLVTFLGLGQGSQMNWLRVALRSQTIDERYLTAGGFTHGFDYLRIFLACAVVVFHSFYSVYGPSVSPDIFGTWIRAVTAPILMMFFALSGFLVAGSFKRRPTLTAFLTLRAIRLIPALAVEVLLSALILGPTLTTLSLDEYFQAKAFYQYFLNILGIIHFNLPGVFETTPASEVNVSLWTVPYELECYLALTLLWVFRIIDKRRAVVAITVVYIAYHTFKISRFYIQSLANSGNTTVALVASFLCGLCIALYSDKIRLDFRLFVAAVVGSIATTMVYQTGIIATIFSAYIVVYLGMSHPPKRSFLLKGDYSYGLYLFAFPLQQTFTYLFPDHNTWYFNSLFALTFGFLYAAFSWWCIEKPILARKRVFVGLTERISESINALLRRR